MLHHAVGDLAKVVRGGPGGAAAHIGMLRAITARDIPRRRAFALECRKSVWAGTGRDAALTQIAQVLADMDLTALTVIFKTVCVHLTVRGPRPAADISHPKLNRVMDDPRDWPCAKARLYAQSPMSSYPRRTFALRPGRDASHDRYTSTAVPLDDRHVLTLISLEHHELTSWIRLGTGSLDARRRRRRPKSRTTSSSDEAADPEPIDQRRDPGRCCKCSGALARSDPATHTPNLMLALSEVVGHLLTGLLGQRLQLTALRAPEAE